MKKFVLAILVAVLLLGLFACDNNQGNKSNNCYVTFKQENQNDIVKTVAKGEDLVDIPELKEKIGYTVAWSIDDFSNITENITVNALYTPKIYTIYLVSDVEYSGIKQLEIKFDEIPSLPTPSSKGKTFQKWTYENGDEYLPVKYNIDGDLSLYAEWKDDGWLGPFM